MNFHLNGFDFYIRVIPNWIVYVHALLHRHHVTRQQLLHFPNITTVFVVQIKRKITNPSAAAHYKPLLNATPCQTHATLTVTSKL